MNHPAFTADDLTFIRAILANPAELTAWLVYADWLDEHENPLQAEFLRLMARREQLSDAEPERDAVETRLKELRGELRPVWVEVFDRPKIENCVPAFQFQCPKQWENLTVTGDPTVRHCEACEKDVHYCHTLPDAQAHARQGHCVAVQLGVLRYPNDLKPRPADEFAFTGILEYYPPAPEPEPAPRRPWWKFW